MKREDQIVMQVQRFTAAARNGMHVTPNQLRCSRLQLGSSLLQNFPSSRVGRLNHPRLPHDHRAEASGAADGDEREAQNEDPG